MAQNRPYQNQVRSAANVTLDLLMAVAANGGVVSNSSANVNYNNTATVNVGVTANGNQSNVAFTVNTSAINYQVDVYQNGTLVIANANLNFDNTATINVAITPNGGECTLQFNANSSSSGGNANAGGVLTGPSWFHVNGWYHQWGEANPGGGSPQMVTFPEPFPNACQSVIVTPFALNETIFVLNVSATAFNVSVGATGQAFMWQADGF
jgi:hypothetical protein